MVEGANLVFLAPSPPVLQFFRGLSDRFFADLDVHEELPSDLIIFSRRQTCRSDRMQYCAERRCFIKPGAPSGF
jgi:hypothetical protein